MAATPSNTKPIPALLAGAAVGASFNPGNDWGAIIAYPALFAGGAVAGKVVGKSLLYGIMGAALGMFVRSKIIQPMLNKAAQDDYQAATQARLQADRAKVAAGGVVYLSKIGDFVRVRADKFGAPIAMISAAQMADQNTMLQAVKQATGVPTITISQITVV